MISVTRIRVKNKGRCKLLCCGIENGKIKCIRSLIFFFFLHNTILSKSLSVEITTWKRAAGLECFFNCCYLRDICTFSIPLSPLFCFHSTELKRIKTQKRSKYPQNLQNRMYRLENKGCRWFYWEYIKYV